MWRPFNLTAPIVSAFLVWLLQGCVSHPTVEEIATAQTRVQEDLPHLGKRVLAGEHSLEQVYALLEEYVRNHRTFYGAAYAAPAGGNDWPGGLFCPYVYRQKGKLIRVNLNDSKYNYPDQHWFKKARDKGKAFWTEPYFDEGGGNIWMVTYAVPLFESGKFAGVITTDFALPTK